jgi:cbb3-type cytochrome oxidase maturation protein
MEIIYLLIPLSLILLGVAIWGFFWAVKSGQFDDLDSPGLNILDDEPSDRTGPPDKDRQ